MSYDIVALHDAVSKWAASKLSAGDGVGWRYEKREDFGGASYMVAVVSRPPDDDLEKVENPLSCAVAVQNMFLEAWGHGIGAVWLSFGVAPPVRGILGVGEGETVVA